MTTLKTLAGVTRTMKSGAKEEKATSAPLVTSVVLLIRQSWCIVNIDVSHNL